MNPLRWRPHSLNRVGCASAYPRACHSMAAANIATRTAPAANMLPEMRHHVSTIIRYRNCKDAECVTRAGPPLFIAEGRRKPDTGPPYGCAGSIKDFFSFPKCIVIRITSLIDKREWLIFDTYGILLLLNEPESAEIEAAHVPSGRSNGSRPNATSHLNDLSFTR